MKTNDKLNKKTDKAVKKNKDKQKTEEFLRLQAEFANFKKRKDSEMMELSTMSKSQVLSDMLPVLDNLDRAVEFVPKELNSNSWVQGVVYINKQLSDLYEEMNIEKFGEIGDVFDESNYEAFEFTSDGEPGIVSKVSNKGYRINGVTIRPAKVTVGEQIIKEDNKEKGDN